MARKPQEGFSVEQRLVTVHQEEGPASAKAWRRERKECGPQLVRGCNKRVHNRNVT